MLIFHFHLQLDLVQPLSAGLPRTFFYFPGRMATAPGISIYQLSPLINKTSALPNIARTSLFCLREYSSVLLQ